MVRKQIYIAPEHEEALKLRALSKGISEAEIIREALTLHLLDRGNAAGRAARVAEFMASGDRIAEASAKEPGFRFVRDELYQERESRWSPGAPKPSGR
ncbi:MAG: hypothetical protein ACI80V_003509 [Rhodothermales bacterium]|jgi:hypothetical protein